jgi:integrase
MSRSLLPFRSFLGKVMREHVSRMRSLGYRYQVNERMLLRFDRFLRHHPSWSGAPLSTLVERWAKNKPTPHRLYEAQDVGRMISTALHRRDPSVAIIVGNPDVRRRARQQHRRPYIYTDDEILRLLRAALLLPSPRAPWRPLALYTMLMLAYCAGLRMGEVTALTVGSIHLQDGAIEIEGAKFFKHRRLPLARGVIAALRRYLVARQKAGAPSSPETGLFWNVRRHARYSYGGAKTLMVQALREAGIKPARGKIGPRIHDLRHTMVAHRMRDWYREGVETQSRLPYLATYLGHKDINSTLVYLNSTPELLQEASQRFRRNAVGALRAVGARL